MPPKEPKNNYSQKENTVPVWFDTWSKLVDKTFADKSDEDLKIYKIKLITQSGFGSGLLYNPFKEYGEYKFSTDKEKHENITHYVNNNKMHLIDAILSGYYIREEYYVALPNGQKLHKYKDIMREDSYFFTSVTGDHPPTPLTLEEIGEIDKRYLEFAVKINQ